MPASTLAESWATALETLPSDWSDAYIELELVSRDDVDRAALHLAPVNPRLDPTAVILRFRCARVAGYGGSVGMVSRCLKRCDGDSIAGEVRVVRALSGSRPVGTQGPVWQIAGRTV